MIFTGTAAELAELTRKHWEAEWWPKGGPTGSDPLSLRGPIGYEWNGQIMDVHTLHDAASIIFSAAMVWLAEKGYEPTPIPPVDFSPGWKCGVKANGGYLYGRGPSPLHAVLAALEVAG